MDRRRTWIATRGARARAATAFCAAWLACLAACSADQAGPPVSTASVDAASEIVPGFDGFSFDLVAADVPAIDDAAPDLQEDDAARDLPDAATQLADDVTATDSGDQGTCKQPCEIDDDCNVSTGGNPADAPCVATVCVMGCCHFDATSGALCDDGIPCNGPDTCKNGKCTPAAPQICDDGLPCTADVCDVDPVTEAEKCVHTTLADWCYIGTSCAQANTSTPGNPCKICDPTQDQDSWSFVPGCCQKDDDCPAKGACDKPTCDVGQGACLIVKIPGCCKSDADCDDGNLCTTDSCDTGSGNCVSLPVACTGTNECQTSICDPSDGSCQPNLEPGWCYVDGACFNNNDANPQNPCQLCLAANQPLAWSSSPGTLCSDGNPCTFSDVCTAAGTCKGTAQPGCCQSDGDCDGGGVPCKMGQCNTSVSLCAIVDKPGCCTAGICCDTADQVILPAGTSCGTAIVSSDYQCSGADIQELDYTAGCSGFSASGCSTATASLSPGAWNTISTCPANTLCTPVGSGVQPTCVVQGSCAGACGGPGTYGCQCSADCVAAGTCCGDATTACGCSSGACCDTTAGIVLASGTPCGDPAGLVQYQCVGKSLQKRTGQGKCAGSSTCSTAAGDVTWTAWQTTQTCNASICTVAADGSSGSCAPLTGSCFASCGVQAHNGNCSCASSCHAAGTCCSDYGYYGCDYGQGCGIQDNTCVNACGGESLYSTCRCDASCYADGTCCPDKYLCGCSP